MNPAKISGERELTIPIRSIATDAEWQDWHWQLRNRITDFDTLRKYRAAAG